MTIRRRANSQRTIGLFCFAILATLIASEATFAQRNTLRRNLQHRISVAWQSQELAAALNRLARVGSIPIWIDRRVDRQRKIDAQLDDLSLMQAFEEIAEAQSLGVATLDDILYIGPRQTAELLPGLIKQAHATLKKLPSSTRHRWLQPQLVNWPRLSQPRELANRWLSDAGIKLKNAEKIPHDLWPAQSYPATPLVDRLMLLLAGFDMTCKITPGSKSCQVIPVPQELKLSKKSTSKKKRKSSSRSKSNNPKSKQQVFSLHLENQPLGAVIDQFAKQLNLQIVWPSGSVAQKSELRKRLVSCDVKNADLDELLRNALSSAKLKHKLAGKKVTILNP